MISDANRSAHAQAAKKPRARHFFVSRHAGAIEWARKYPWAIRAEFLHHLDPCRIEAGDTVIGTLPAQLAAEVCARGARYLHLSIALSAEQRGADLTADQLEEADACLVPYIIHAETGTTRTRAQARWQCSDSSTDTLNER